MTSMITIHGDEWKLDDIADLTALCLAHKWHKEVWCPTSALVHKKGGRISQYHGQKFDPEKIDLVPDGWSHDHCEICCWALHESNDPENGVGYRNETNGWLCSECFEKLIKPKLNGQEL
jgi:hypothetical protein